MKIQTRRPFSSVVTFVSYRFASGNAYFTGGNQVGDFDKAGKSYTDVIDESRPRLVERFLSFIDELSV